MRKRILSLLVLALAILAAAGIYSFEETRQLGGVVRDATTRAPIESAAIQLDANTVTTNAQGRYAIAVARGAFTLTVTADGYAPGTATVNGDDLFAHSFTLDLLLAPNRVTGIVRDTETNQPSPNAPIAIGNTALTANAQGVIETRGVKSGTTIVVQVPGYQPAAFAFDGRSDFDLPLTPNTVAILVTDQYTNQPIANARIQNDGAPAATDAEGRVILRRVKTGARVRAAAPGYEAGSVAYSGSDIRIALRPNTLDGIVTDAATGQPISGTLVYLGETIVTTNAKGAYHLDPAPAKASLSFKMPGYRKTQIDASGTAKRDVKLTPFLVKAIHIPFGMPAERVRELIDQVNTAELNAIVIDVKNEKGRIAWDSQVPLARDIGAATARGIELLEVVERCRTQNIYCIARLAVFQDTLLANARPSLAIRYANGSVFTESGGAAWANPYNPDVWNYNIALAKEIVALGFDEVQFDYVRFPGRVSGIVFGTDYTEETRVAAIAGFLAKAQRDLRPTGVFISADVFGLTTATEDDQYTGQRLHDMGPYLDYISPMVYPDTWVEAMDLISKGLGIHNCLEATRCPYDIIYNSYKRAVEKTSTKVRLWLQAYPGRADYGVKEFRLQRKAANDAGSVGWMFWSGTGTYDFRTFDPPAQ
ncbi:MAG: carboxypeptidase regulatory-like domain-containing protein [Chloroflexota bacterium]|nr:carboxypeptidase regulatory-like domain-containing protein [Chloroflexota bacterium]